jgi:hypothetical protein
VAHFGVEKAKTYVGPSVLWFYSYYLLEKSSRLFTAPLLCPDDSEEVKSAIVFGGMREDELHVVFRVFQITLNQKLGRRTEMC